jgi:hypothetical protein
MYVGRQTMYTMYVMFLATRPLTFYIDLQCTYDMICWDNEINVQPPFFVPEI